MSWGATLHGLGSTLDMLSDLQMRFDDDAVYLVGSNVTYAIFQELGTSRQPAQPYLIPAAREVQRELPKLAQQADSMDDLLKTAAFKIEQKAKDRAPVDTGTLRASISSQKIT